MNNQELQKQKKYVEIFIELKIELDRLNSEVNRLGWGQRNALISHVYSDYTMHDELNEKRNLWSKTHKRMNVVKWIYDVFVKERDIYGYFETIENIDIETTELLNKAIETEKYEIADELKKWIDKCNQ